MKKQQPYTPETIDYAHNVEVIESSLYAGLNYDMGGFNRYVNSRTFERYYFKKGKPFFYMGVTGPIGVSWIGQKMSKALNKVKLSHAMETGEDISEAWGERADYGTLFHTMVKLHYDFMNGDGKKGVKCVITDRLWLNTCVALCDEMGYTKEHFFNEWHDDLINDFAAWFNFCKEKNVKVLGCEVQVCDDMLRFATCLDIVCELDFNRGRKRAYIDIKTGTHASPSDSYACQCALGVYMFNNNTTGEPIECAFIWNPKDRVKNPTDFYFSKDLAKAYNADDFELISRIAIKSGMATPKGYKIRYYQNEDGTITATRETPQEYLNRINQTENENQ